MSVPVDSIALHARLSPHSLAARELVGGRSWTYAQFDKLVGQAAALLRERGVGAGDRLAVVAFNSAFQVALHHACARIGALYAPMNWRLSPAEIEGLTARAEPRLLLTEGAVEAGRDGFDIAAFQAEAEGLQPLESGWVDPQRPSLILFTSGTSGRPKGVILSERALARIAANFGVATRVERSARVLCDAPMFHIIGLATNIRPTLAVGGAILISPGFNAARTLNWLSDPGLAVSHYVGVPQMLEALRREPAFDVERLRHLTALVTGGAPHAPDDLRAWLDDGIPMVSGYGSSEAGTVFGQPVDIEVIRETLGAAGVPSPSIELRVIDDAGKNVAPGESGELLLRGPNLFSGYWNDPEETAKVIDADGWYATGDIVRRDDNGFFWIVDRKKDMFISGGENIYPAEIEALLVGYPTIKECAVIGVPDPTWGEVGRLVVTADGDFDEAALRAFLAERLARYKLPRYVSVLDALPRTATGKIRKDALRAMLAD